MKTTARARFLRTAFAAILAGQLACAGPAAGPEPIVYTVRFPSLETQVAEIEATVPTEGRASVDLMMAVWSPGFYRVEDYAGKVASLSAHAPDGAALAVERPAGNRWRIDTGGHRSVVVTYRLSATGRSVTTNWVGPDYAVLNGPATFITLAGSTARPHEVRLELPPGWARSMTGLDPAPDGLPHHYRAPDFDTLADSPIVAGNPVVSEFDVEGTRHLLVDIGERGEWNSASAADKLARIVAEVAREWGGLPFERYVFLNVFRRGGGGLEHLNSTLLTSSPNPAAEPTLRWLKFAAHEYVHALNVKRLRPVELGPFDYERPPTTGSLWISEGLTTYYGDLAVARSGVGSLEDLLAGTSSRIRQLQASPGRLVQTLEQSSLGVWTNSTSGVGTDPATTVSYYVKGAVVGLLLDARIRRLTGDAKSLDDAMRLALERFGGERGFTPEEFEATAAEVAGADLGGWFAHAIRSTAELDYGEMLDWWGLRFAEADPDDPATAWALEVRPDATGEQRRHLEHLIQIPELARS